MQIFNYGELEIEYLKKQDKELAVAINRIGFIEREVIPDLFSALVNSIISQQIATKAATTIWNRFLIKFNPITPQVLLNADDEDLKSCGISYRKVQYIKNIALEIINGSFDIDALNTMTDEEVCNRLSKLSGVGVWTAEMMMIFSLQRKNILSYGDLMIKRGMMSLYHLENLDKKTFLEFKKRYSPYATIASLYLWEISKGK